MLVQISRSAPLADMVTSGRRVLRACPVSLITNIGKGPATAMQGTAVTTINDRTFLAARQTKPAATSTSLLEHTPWTRVRRPNSAKAITLGIMLPHPRLTDRNRVSLTLVIASLADCCHDVHDHSSHSRGLVSSQDTASHCTAHEFQVDSSGNRRLIRDHDQSATNSVVNTYRYLNRFCNR